MTKTGNILSGIENSKAPVYFLGIGGIGMSALARYFNSRGHRVSGYDRTESALTRQMTEEGMTIHYEDKVSLADKDAALVIYTPAIPEGHKEMEFFKNKRGLSGVTISVFASGAGGPWFKPHQ